MDKEYDTENPEILECPEGSNCEPSNENEEICKCKIDEKKDLEIVNYFIKIIVNLI